MSGIFRQPSSIFHITLHLNEDKMGNTKRNSLSISHLTINRTRLNSLLSFASKTIPTPVGFFDWFFSQYRRPDFGGFSGHHWTNLYLHQSQFRPPRSNCRGCQCLLHDSGKHMQNIMMPSKSHFVIKMSSSVTCLHANFMFMFASGIM